MGKLYEGFISCRQDSLELAGAIAAELEAAGVSCAYQNTIKQDENRSHKKAVIEYVGLTNFSVVLVQPNFHERSDLGLPNYQFKEIDEILERIDDEDHHEELVGTENYRCFVVFLSETMDTDWESFKQTLLSLKRDDRKTGNIYYRLFNAHPRTHWITEFKKPNSLFRKATMMNLVATILTQLEDDRKARLTGRHLPSAEAGEPAAGTKSEVASAPATAPAQDPLKDLTETFLEKSVNVWRKGAIPGTSQVKGGRRAKQTESEFAFNCARFMELEGEQAGVTGGAVADAGPPRLPMSEWLLNSQSGIVYVTGEAGAGKTTVVAAAALAYAAHYQPKYLGPLKEFANGAWLESAEKHLSGSPAFIPICLSVSQLMTHLPDPINISDAEFNQAILSAMKEIANRKDDGFSALTANDIDRLFQSNNVVLILDGLDEVPNNVSEQIHDKARDLFWSQRREDDFEFRLIITSRPGLARNDDEVHLRLLSPDLDAIQEFVRRYVAAQGDDDRQAEQQAQLMEKVTSHFGSRDVSETRLVKRPMLLNLFCWNYCNYGGFFEQLEFCSGVIRHLTTGRDFEAIRSRLAGEDKSSEAVTLVARQILGWLALRTFERNVDTTKSVQTSTRKTRAELVGLAQKFGLVEIMPACAGQIIKDLAVETNLFEITDKSISFREHLLFCEYLVSEAIGDREPQDVVRDIEPNQASNWSNPLTFAERRYFDEACISGNMDDAHPYSNALLVTAERLAAQNRPSDALKLLEVAIKVLDENQDVESERLPREVLMAVELFRSIKRHLSSRDRDEVMHNLLKLGVRDYRFEQRRAVQLIFDALLHPRRPWVECKAPDLPEGYRLADAPVHVSAYQLFCESDDALEDQFWPHVPDDPDMIDPRDSLFGTSNADERARGMWVAQSSRPGGPVGGVNWFEAVAYCLWVTRLLQRDGALDDGELIRLPTSAEWLAVSLLCANGKEFPFGNEIDNEVANTGFLMLDGASPAGVFEPREPGLYDFGSNIRCWTTHDTETPELVWPPRRPRTYQGWVETSDKPRVGGGSWACQMKGYFRAGVRPATEDPFSRSHSIGFRLAKVRVSGNKA